MGAKLPNLTGAYNDATDCASSNFQELSSARNSIQVTLRVPADSLDLPTEKLDHISQNKLISGLCGQFATMVSSAWRFVT